jgi:hypothetical protein
MLSKQNEVELYSRMYILAFDKNKSFFYNNDADTIYAFLTENYWGEQLQLQLKLLVNLLANDSEVNTSIMKKELAKKSEKLSRYLNQNQE